MSSSYGAPAGWCEDGSLLIRRSFGAGPDPHERVTRISVKDDGGVVVSEWVEGLYGKGEKYAKIYELSDAAADRIRHIMEGQRGGRVPPEVERALLGIA